MPLHKIRPLHVMWQEGVKPEMLIGIFSGIATTLCLAGVFDTMPKVSLGQRRLPDWYNSLTGEPRAHFSLDWYIDFARKNSQVPGHLNSQALLDILATNPTHIDFPRYELVVVKDPLHWNYKSTRIVGGVGWQGRGAIITLADKLPFLWYEPNTSAAAKKEGRFQFSLYNHMVTIHELCHLLGLFPGITVENPTDDQLRAAHCQNECVMRWGVDIDLYKKIIEHPLCSDCEKNLPLFFITS